MRAEPAGLHHGLPPHAAVVHATHLLHLPITEDSKESLVPNHADHRVDVIRMLPSPQDTVKLSLPTPPPLGPLSPTTSGKAITAALFLQSHSSPQMRSWVQWTQSPESQWSSWGHSQIRHFILQQEIQSFVELVIFTLHVSGDDDVPLP